MSVCRMQISLAFTHPPRAKDRRKEDVDWVREACISIRRMMPYIPNFRSTPAKNIEPVTGAST